ncbi:MAG: PEP-CTERM sorting domain-containing protein [Rubrivivax sp.]|nr:PEP-CTERM sorting domain-containing protein [Rubrivivax sp.]
MIKASATRLLLCGVLAVAGGLASLQPADAAPARVRFTPPYGTPFPNLEWFGEAVIDDGSCAASGTISNLVGGCAGQFSITSATVYFADVSAPTVPLGHIDFNGGQVVQVERNSPAPTDWTSVFSTPFNPQLGMIEQTKYDPDGAGGLPAQQAYFSLIFVGDYAQLYWFQKDPGDPLLDPLAFPYVNFASAPYYVLCAQEGDNAVGNRWLHIAPNRCGFSDNVEGQSGKLFFANVRPSEVPEPGSLALVLAAGIGAAGLARRARGAKS